MPVSDTDLTSAATSLPAVYRACCGHYFCSHAHVFPTSTPRGHTGSAITLVRSSCRMDCIRSSKLFGTLLRKLSLTRWVETLKLALRGGPLHTVGVNALRFFHGAKSHEACCGVKFQTACKQTISTRLHTHTLTVFPVPMASRTLSQRSGWTLCRTRGATVTGGCRRRRVSAGVQDGIRAVCSVLVRRNHASRRLCNGGEQEGRRRWAVACKRRGRITTTVGRCGRHVARIDDRLLRPSCQLQ
jgi:hypothetical protein